LSINSYAAYLENVPVEVMQPNGQVVKCFATGDEFHNWLHDKNNYTIVRNKETGYYVYAILKDGVFSDSDFVVGKIDPIALGIKPGLNIPRQKPYLKSASGEDRSFAPTSGDFNNIVIYIRFADQAEFTESQTNYESMFNGEDFSLKGYFSEVSGSQLNVYSTFYPAPQNNTIVSYQDIHNRDYYVPYDATSNPEGYVGEDERREREHILLENAIEAVRTPLESSGINFDSDADGYIDNICFIIQGATEGWSDLLWPHKWALYTRTVTIGGSRVWEYNFQLSERTNVSVLCHEMFHTLGAPDLYHYNEESDHLYPVAGWDLMASNTAQHMLTWMKFKYGKWMDEVPEIFGQGTYKLPAVGNNPFACYKIRVPESTNEFFMVEYRKREGYDTNLSGSYDEGLLVYRVNSSYNGNASGPPDELYVLRPGVTAGSPNGNWYDATLSENQNRTAINSFSDPLPLLTDSNESSLSIYEVGFIGDSIEFKVGDPVISSDTLEITQLLPQTPSILSVNDTVSIHFYYQTTGENILINVALLSAGQEVEATTSNQSLVYSEKLGVGVTDFSCNADCTVDELRFRFLNSSTQNILFETFVPVYYRFVEDSIQYNIETDSLALIALYNTCNGSGWNNNTNWLSNEPLANWYGVSVENGRVTGLQLFSDDWSVRFGLQGELPAAFGNLTKLKLLNFQGNELSGSIPVSLGRLLELENLNLVQNNFTGELPTELGNLAFLSSLNLYANNISGELPIELGELIGLAYLNLGSNNFSGNFGEIIGGLTQLQTLYLSYNNFTGNLPVELGNLQNLYSLYLSGNKFNGGIPNELFGLQNLRYLYLDYNELSGELPAALGNLTNIWSIRLNNNMFDGELPSAFGNLNNLHYLYLSNNNFTGILPDELCTIPLSYIQLGFNNLDSLSCPVVQCLIENGVDLSGDLEQQSGYTLGDCIEKPEGYAINEHSVVYADFGMFYDSGFNLDYSNNENETITFSPATQGKKLSFNFLEFSTEGCCDYLRVYDGATIDEATLIGEYRGTNEFMEQLVATNDEGALTFYFYSDGSVTDLGWKAEISTLEVIDSSYTLSCNDVSISNGEITACTYDFAQTDIIIPDTLCGQVVVSIGDNAFSSKGITSVKMPSTLVSISNMAFQSNPIISLDLSICSELSDIGSYAFANSQIEELWLPESLNTMGTACFSDNQMTHLNGNPFDGVFYYLNNGSTDSSYVNSYGGVDDFVVVPEWVESVGAWAYSGAELQGVTLPDGLNFIAYQAFSRNRLTSVEISGQVTVIDRYAFDSNNLDSLFIPNSVVQLGKNAFSNNNLSSVIFETASSIEEIEENAFANNNNLTQIVLPSHINPDFLNYEDNQGNVYFVFDLITDFSLAYYAFINPLTECPQHFHPVWEGNGVYDPMNVYIVDAKIEGADLVPGDEIGVYDGNLCVGFGKVINTINQQAVLSIIVSSNDGNANGFTPGHEISYKFWRCNAEVEFDVSNIQCFNNQYLPQFCSTFQSGATSYVGLGVSTRIDFVADFQPGWNIFSAPLVLDSADMKFNFQDLINNNILVKIQDETGTSLEDRGIFGGWDNSNIMDLTPGKGFKVKVNVYDSIYLYGNSIEYPFSIPLSPGWNIMGYPTLQYADGMEILGTLIANTTLIKVQDERGNSIENLGVFGGWQNFIGNFYPGEGYKIKVSDVDTLWIYEMYPKSTIIASNKIAPLHFKPVFEGNGVDHMNFNLVALSETALSAGDEIAVFDGTACVGAVTLLPDDFKHDVVSIPASAADKNGMAGFVDGNLYQLKVWKAEIQQEQDFNFEVISGEQVFTKHESVILGLTTKLATANAEGLINTNECSCYPNPFANEITINIKLSNRAEVALEVINQFGQTIKYIRSKSMLNSGGHTFKWNGENQNKQKVSSGIYYLRIDIDGEIQNEKMMYNR
jgi:M6 family metalloprotease-like protein